MENLRCDVCFERYSNDLPAFTICPNGHSCCSPCNQQSGAYCPFCRNKKTKEPIKNILLMQLVQKIEEGLEKNEIIDSSELQVEDSCFACGHSSDVYRAKFNQQTVAVKVFRLISGDVNKMIRNEINVSIGLQHPNVIASYGTTEIDSKVAIVMQYGVHGTLTKKIPSLSVDEAHSISLGIISGLKYLHSKKIVHRDLKPCNIILKEGLVPCISDFGISKIMQTYTTMNTSVGNGSFRYAPPELFTKGAPIDYACDIYSLSMVLYHLFTKKDPWDDCTDFQVLGQMLANGRPADSDEIPKPLMALIKRMPRVRTDHH